MAEQKSKKKMIVIFIVIGLLAGFFSYAYATKQFILKTNIKKETKEYTFSLDDIVVNLQDGDGTRYLKTEIILEYTEEKADKELEEKKANISDIVIRILRNKNTRELMSVKGTDQLKKEIHQEANKIFEKNIITDVYITDFLIQ